MNITEIRINKIDGEKLKAFASITIDNNFVVTGLKVVDGSKGLFVAMPSQKGSNGEFRDVAFPINQETKDLITEKVLSAYNDKE